MTARPEGPGHRGAEEPRDFVRYLFWHLRPEWRRLAHGERDAQIEEFRGTVEAGVPDLTVRTYSLVGTKAAAHGLFWMIAPRVEAFQAFEARLLGCRIAGYLDFPFSYLGMARRSEYLGGHRHAGQEGDRMRPHGRPYLFVYPFIKTRAWYGLSFESRRKIMAEHLRVGHRFPGVEIHTGYTFGIDDAEFILGFEAESPGEFLDLVQALRPSRASRYTALETPIFTAVAVPPERMIALAAGRP